MRRFFRENGLSLVLFWMFFLTCLLGLSLTGYRHENEERKEHGLAVQGYSEYLRSNSFWEAATENWESEFLQMFVYVALTAFLFQKGSSESKKIDEENPQDRDPRKSKDNPDAPWPVRRGGWVLKLYENSLSLAFFLLFAVSFILHGVSGAGDYSEDQVLHGGMPISALEYMAGSRFWYESFQNWQSEFLAIWAMVVFSIWLRQRASPESKPVDAPHSQTGTD